MKNEKLYNKTVDILVQAYFNDTLQHGNPCGCAIGNIVAANNNIEMVNDGFRLCYRDAYPSWFGIISFISKKKDTIKQAKSTGYSVRDVLKIENAFESIPPYLDADERMFGGLMAVIDVLDEIHENNDVETTKSTKQKFHKQLA